MRNQSLRLILAVGGAVASLAPRAGRAQEPSVTEKTHKVEEVVVEDQAEETIPFGATPATGSSLGLTTRETPAVVDVITEQKIEDLGARTTEEALNRAPGVNASNNATSPGALSLRGFTGAGRAVLLLYDGVRPAEEAFFTRVMDSFLFERIEVLQGPSSVNYGEGALAGVINLVPKRPRLGGQDFAAQAGFGSFGSFKAGADANVALHRTLAVRPVLSYMRTSGYVSDAGSNFLALTVPLKWVPTDRLTFDVAFDYLRDDYNSAYFGTPLIPAAAATDPSDLVKSPDGRVLDKSLQGVGYNVTDGVVDSNTYWTRTGVTFRFNDAWSLNNAAHAYWSDRRFINSEYFGFNSMTSQVDRSTGIVTHDFRYWTDRLTLNGDFKLGSLRNRLAVGGSFSDVSFFTKRRFGSTASVDLRNPIRGQFPQGDDPMIFGRRENRDNGLRTAAAFVEDGLNITSRWLLVGGLRYEHNDVDRVAINLNTTPETRTPVDRAFNHLTWRIGSVYDVLPKTQVFAQYSTAASPPSSLLVLSPSGVPFDMTTGRAVEAGVKSSLLDDRLAFGLSGFYIQQDKIVTKDANDPMVSVQGGKRSSLGAELTVGARLLSRLRVDANYTHLDARFDALTDDMGKSLKGNTPSLVPERILNAFVYFDAPVLPLTASFGVHHAGRYFTDDANTIEVGGYTTLEAALRYRLTVGRSITDFTLRGRNLTDAFYASYTDISPDQLTIAAPRSVDLLVTARY